jgi:hypothetical protein
LSDWLLFGSSRVRSGFNPANEIALLQYEHIPVTSEKGAIFMNSKVFNSLVNVVVLATGSLLSAESGRASIVTSASDNSTVQPGGPRTGSNGQRFFNMEGSSNGTFASFGVIDFSIPGGATLGPTGVVLSLGLTQNNAAFSNNGGLMFYLTTDTTTNIDAGTSPLVYNSADLPTGLDSQLNTRYLLGSAMFTEVSTGTLDMFNFSPSGAALTYLLNQVNVVHGPIRLIVAPGDATVAATYSGFSNTSTAGPELTLENASAAVPEPGTLIFVISGLAILFGYAYAHRRRARGEYARASGCR